MSERALRRILCIDDESDILEVVKLCLETVGGFEVICCNDSRKAVDVAQRQMPDLILLDVMMPAMDGPATLAAIRKAPALDGVPVVFMTARMQPSEVDEYLALGAVATVPKPFDPIMISAMIGEIWDNLP